MNLDCSLRVVVYVPIAQQIPASTYYYIILSVVYWLYAKHEIDLVQPTLIQKCIPLHSVQHTDYQDKHSVL